MAERVGREKIEKEDGYLYYVGKDGAVWKSPMRSNPRGKKARVSSERIEKEDGYLYFIDKNGYVARTEMNRSGRQSKGKARKASKSMRSKAQRRRR
ncbi:MAG: hypothetical protein QXN59_00530 [Candidatus Micrarchaeaceae archaeon]